MEYDKLGYGRIDVFTKPGTSRYHGGGYYNYGDDFWNSRNLTPPRRPRSCSRNTEAT